MKPFEYLEPKDLTEACALLSRYKQRAKLIAGGTDLLVSMKQQRLTLEYVINIKVISELDYVHHDKDGLKIGTLATLSDIESSPIVRERLPVLAETAHQMAMPAIRNMATIGGNLCNAAPSADMAPPLIGLGARIKIVGLQGERTVTAEEFFIGPSESALRDGEILTEIQVPNTPPHTGGVYLKMPARTATDIALVGVAALITLDSKHASIVNAKIVLGAVAPTPLRARKAEEVLIGKTVDDKLFEEAAQAAAQEAKPISDVRGSADYRREMVKVFTRGAIREAIAKLA